MPDIPRLTDDELTALLATHKECAECLDRRGIRVGGMDGPCPDCNSRGKFVERTDTEIEERKTIRRLVTEVEERRDEEKAKKEEGGR